MDINITRFFNEAAPNDYQKSIAEAGPTAGPDSWNASLGDVAEFGGPMLSTPEQLQAMRDHVRGFGAWDDEDLAAWGCDELNALFIQIVAGDMKDYCTDVSAWDWDEYESGCEAGIYSGRIGRGVEPGTVFYCLES